MADQLLSPRSADASIKMSELSGLPYSDQAIWFLNGFWADHQKDAEDVYGFVQLMAELDPVGAAGGELDMLNSARFLEKLNAAMPALQRKEALKTIDADSNGKVSMIEYLAWRYKKLPKEVADAPQGDNSEAIAKAQAKLAEVQKALAEVLAGIDSLKKEQEKLKILEAELEAAVAALKAEEDAFNGKIAALDKIANDPTSPRGVKKSKASAELAQMKAEDPLPLRRAKITQEAALRKVGKQKKAVEASLADLERKQEHLQSEMQAAEEELTKAEKSGGGGKGAIWYMKRELFEADKYLPKSKQKWDHSKPFPGI